LDPFAYTASHPGKGVRARLFGAFNVWMNVPQAEMEIIEKVVSMLHDASLMWAIFFIYFKLHPVISCTVLGWTISKTILSSDVVDRVLDDWCSTPITNFSAIAAHTVYGIPRTINAATYVHTMVYQELSHMKSPHSEYSDLVMILTGTSNSLANYTLGWRATAL
jgi:geranylgeranyl diphosphate synthase type 3